MLDEVFMKDVQDLVRLTALFDAYGQLLSNAQKSSLQQLLYFDLTGSEIAQNNSISRQAVKDSQKKAIRKLEEFENKLHFVEKTDKLLKEIERLKRGG